MQCPFVLLLRVNNLFGIHLNLILWRLGAAFKLNLIGNLEGYIRAKILKLPF
jgi:hypothetical protein